MPELRLKSRSSAGASPLRQKSRSSAGANKTAEWTVPQIPLKTRARWQVPKIPGALRPKLVMKLTDALEWTDMEARAAAAEGERLMTEFANFRNDSQMCEAVCYPPAGPPVAAGLGSLQR